MISWFHQLDHRVIFLIFSIRRFCSVVVMPPTNPCLLKIKNTIVMGLRAFGLGILYLVWYVLIRLQPHCGTQGSRPPLFGPWLLRNPLVSGVGVLWEVLGFRASNQVPPSNPGKCKYILALSGLIYLSVGFDFTYWILAAGKIIDGSQPAAVRKKALKPGLTFQPKFYQVGALPVGHPFLIPLEFFWAGQARSSGTRPGNGKQRLGCPF
jgi:hypothetical protein